MPMTTSPTGRFFSQPAAPQYFPARTNAKIPPAPRRKKQKMAQHEKGLLKSAEKLLQQSLQHLQHSPKGYNTIDTASDKHALTAIIKCLAAVNHLN